MYLYFRYEPENFIGLIYAMEKPNVTVTFFDTGKVNVTGGKSICLFLTLLMRLTFFFLNLSSKEN